jgi:catechol 2,3-dioxygenase-like lactoylglutathione lyase family enzyme
MTQLVPILSITDLERSLRFYTEVLDFTVAPWDADLSSPVIDLLREGTKFQLTLLGEVPPGIAFNVEVEDVDELFRSYKARGLDTSTKPNSPVHQGPLDQSWGTREFYVTDPDGNTLRFRHYPD